MFVSSFDLFIFLLTNPWQLINSLACWFDHNNLLLYEKTDVKTLLLNKSTTDINKKWDQQSQKELLWKINIIPNLKKQELL
jgi:hypothetical protein